MSKSAGSGNAAWKASRRMSQAQPGNANRRRCKVIKRSDGQPCRGMAVRGCTVCYLHGGARIIAHRKLRRRVRKLRYRAWTDIEATSNAKG